MDESCELGCDDGCGDGQVDVEGWELGCLEGWLLG